MSDLIVEVIDDGSGGTTQIALPDTTSAPTIIEVDPYIELLQRVATIEGIDATLATTAQLSQEIADRIAADNLLRARVFHLVYDATAHVYPTRPPVPSVTWIGPIDPGAAAVDGDLWVNTL